jgi:integrase/recombinase XerD
MEQVKHVIGSMSDRTEIERRNRALVAFTLLTGARDSAIASMKLKHIDLQAGSVFQDARDGELKTARRSGLTFSLSVRKSSESRTG